jgi:hypothetical protein
MSEEIKCVCGHTKGEHSSEFAYAHTTKSQCATFRPELPWPDKPGYWAMNKSFCGEKWQPVMAWYRMDGEIEIMRLDFEGNVRRSELKPDCRFTRLLVANPFGSEQ